MSAKKLGFVGLGIMGSPMAGHLIKGGHSVYLATRSQVPEDLTKAVLVAAGRTAPFTFRRLEAEIEREIGG